MDEFKKMILPILGVIIFIVAVGMLYGKPVNKNSFLAKFNQTKMADKKEIKVGDTAVKVEVVKTTEERSKGLSGRESIGENEGMLFVFDQASSSPSFWMKDMEFAIDIIWINKDKVVKIHKNVRPPEEGTTQDKLLIYRPDTPVEYVLEVKANFCDTNEVKVGTKVDLSGLN